MNRKTTLIIVTGFTMFLVGILISLQLKNLNRQDSESFYENQDLLLIQDEVMALIRENNTLSDENQKLSDYVNLLSDELTGDDIILQQIIEEKSRAEIFAGMTDVSGPGLTIMLDFGPDVPVKSGTVLLLVNELRAAGALAISVQNERVVAMTEIRDVGTANPQIMINGNQYSSISTFSIKAVFREYELNRGIQLISDLTGQIDSYGSISVNSTDNVVIDRLSEDSLTYRKID
jgi:uncharacterized protein YlxW (UPF0749 family)